jgi:hypothetical protein
MSAKAVAESADPASETADSVVRSRQDGLKRVNGENGTPRDTLTT